MTIMLNSNIVIKQGVCLCRLQHVIYTWFIRRYKSRILVDRRRRTMAVVCKKGIFIVSAKRTPFGKMRGVLRDVTARDLLAVAATAALRDAAVPPEAVDTANVGQVYTISGSEGAMCHRHAVLKSGVSLAPVLSVNLLCGSGFQAVVNSTQDILTNVAKISLAAGTESMSLVPFLVRNLRFGNELVKPSFEDFLMSGSLDTYCNYTMAQTAENLAEIYGLQREELDLYAYKSQQKWKKGFEQGAFKAEMAPVTVVIQGRKVVVDKDEHPRPDTTMEVLRKLPPAFRENGVGTVGNSTGVNNGAGAIILASEEAVKVHQLQPLARVVGWSRAGVEPALMGLGPVPAATSLLTAARCRMDDVDMVEINEPFAGQALASALELRVDPEKVNMNGGAIAVGHPPAASGARILAHLTHELRRKGLKSGIGMSCIGGGQGIALLIESV